MAEITLHGNKVHTQGNLPATGSKAPDFTLVNQDLENTSLADFQDKLKLMVIVPSVDTPVCATSTKKFNEMAEKYSDAAFLVISADLPFAMSRFCSSEGTKNVISLSLMRGKGFAKDYGVLMQDGPLAGITARAVIVIDKDDVIQYTQLVKEIADEPDYEEAADALSKLLVQADQ